MAHSYILEQVDIFEDLSSSQLDLIGEICQEQSHDQDDVIFEENTPSREFFTTDDDCDAASGPVFWRGYDCGSGCAFGLG
jgi:hypothetical protein